MEIRDIFICMNVCKVFSMVRSRTHLRITLIELDELHISHGRSSPTSDTDSNIAHTPRKKRKQIIEKAVTGERSQT